ncbi:MAG: hypothetical protein Pg6A_01350 [Termitinemataceae bacterium]|nr:MAG: hypothetical protein Pg6A_01350 [Termitinemataceae bacterium]
MAKKYLIVLAVFVTVSTENAFSQNYGANSFGTYSLNSSFDIFKFQKESAFDNTINPRLNLSPLAIPASGAFAINFVIGLGIGSFLQEDILGGIIGLSGELVGLGLIIGGLALAASNITAKKYNGTTTYYYGEYYGLGNGMMIAGLVMFGGTRIFEIIRPWLFE